MKKLYILCCCILISSCAYYPKHVERYDPDCNIHYKQLEIGESKENMLAGNCSNESCIAALLSIPIQAIVAGSITIAGNIVYWLGKEGECIIK